MRNGSVVDGQSHGRHRGSIAGLAVHHGTA